MMRCASSILAVCLPVAAMSQPVDYRLLFDAIAAVESSRGATSANVYQIRRIYVLDVNRMTGKGYWYEAVTADERLARACMRDYWRCWLARTGAPVTYETLARIITDFDAILKATCTTSGGRCLMKMLADSRTGKTTRYAQFYLTTKALLRPESKLIALRDKENLDLLNSYKVLGGVGRYFI